MGERFIINAENISFLNLFTEIAKLINKPAPKFKMSKFGLQVFRRINNLVTKAKITSTMVAHSSGTYIYSNKKISNTLGYSFVPIRQCLERTATFFNHEATV